MVIVCEWSDLGKGVNKVIDWSNDVSKNWLQINSLIQPTCWNCKQLENQLRTKKFHEVNFFFQDSYCTCKSKSDHLF